MMPLKRLFTVVFLLGLSVFGVISLAQDATPTGPQFNLPITRDVTYVVRPRDTLDSIGAFFDVSIDCLRTTNKLNPLDILRPDTELVVSVDCPPYTGANVVAVPRTDAREVREGRYFVKQNDTLDTIGQALNISVEALAQANDISEPFRLTIGQELVIPQDAPPYGVVLPSRVLGQDQAATPQPSTGSQGGNTYVVQPNDTLDTIGQELNVSVEALYAANGIEPGFILLPGDVLTIPQDAPPYGVVPPSRVLGQTAATPTGTGSAGGEPTLRGANRLNAENTYVVQRNDTLDTIAQQLNVSLEALYAANGIEPGFVLLPGDVLTIPQGAPPYGVVPPSRVLGQNPAATAQPSTGAGGGATENTYVVQPNDTLDTIGQKLNVSVVALAVANDIKTGFILLPGDVLTVPADAPPYGEFASLGEPAGATIASGDVYVIQPGDTIDTIGQRLNVDRQCIIDANQIALPRAIRPGQVIGIPRNCPPYRAFSAPSAMPTPATP